MSDIDTAVVDSLTCLTPDGRLEKRTLLINSRTSPRQWKNTPVALLSSKELPGL